MVSTGVSSAFARTHKSRTVKVIYLRSLNSIMLLPYSINASKRNTALLKRNKNNVLNNKH